MLDEILLPSFEVEFLVESRPLARRLHDAGMQVIAADLRRTDTYVKADLTPSTCVIVEDNGRRSLTKILEAIRDAGGTLVYVIGVGITDSQKREEALKSQFEELNYLTFAELFGTALITEFSRSITRLKVQQYQRYFIDAERVLILTHNDPDPDAMASALALRNVLRRTKQTAILGCLQGVTRPENQRMVKLLDIGMETIKPESVHDFDRIAMVDVQPHYFPGLVERVDLVIDHHPEQPGYNAVFKDIRPDYGSTSTILTEHLRAVDVNISERTATAMLYAIKSDTLFFNRQANRVDLEAFSYLYPLADAALIRKMEGAEITMERLEYVLRAKQHGRMEEQVFCAFLGASPREDFIPYVADFYLQLENVKWTIIAGVVNDSLVMSVRNLGYSRNAGEFVRRFFADLGSAGGHRAMAKAVVPLRAFREKFGELTAEQFADRILELMSQFLHEHQPPDKKREPVRA
jgi:nanoRNase/pAp phosphatase (c-di-AMP/oligoRNAs hydrolase)